MLWNSCTSVSGRFRNACAFGEVRIRTHGELNMLKAYGLATAALLAGFATQVQADEIIVNGGFETAGASETESANWFAVVAGAPGTLSLRDSTSPRTGSFAQRIRAVGANAIGSTGGLVQNSMNEGGLGSLEQGTTVSATFYAKAVLGPGGVGFYTLRILNRDGAIVASSGLGAMNDTAGAYRQFSMGPLTVPAFGAPPNDAFASMVEIVVSAGAFPESNVEAFIDDVSVIGTLVAGCDADFNSDGIVDFFDYLDFVDSFSAQAPAADYNNDGIIDFFDYLDFVDAFSAGC